MKHFMYNLATDRAFALQWIRNVAFVVILGMLLTSYGVYMATGQIKVSVALVIIGWIGLMLPMILHYVLKLTTKSDVVVESDADDVPSESGHSETPKRPQPVASYGDFIRGDEVVFLVGKEARIGTFIRYTINSELVVRDPISTGDRIIKSELRRVVRPDDEVTIINLGRNRYMFSFTQEKTLVVRNKKPFRVKSKPLRLAREWVAV